MEFIRENIGTAIVLFLLALAVFFAIRGIVRSRKNGKGGCSGGCVGCPMAGRCHTDTEDKDKK